VTEPAEARRHPQDALWSERPLGCVEVVVPSSGGHAAGSFYQASRAKEGIPVMILFSAGRYVDEIVLESEGARFRKRVVATTRSSSFPCRSRWRRHST
jgi:hypothetical protein